ncbi:MAG: RcnB family protein [Gammaproteobacteria bacterium]|nr:RcnB family protein [Gammaproteobacteria bacterium]MDH5303893.1 RcnB family protein [Gammaproteobacteria bacterium]MDH5322375.1 RcnB family protein [Gammaproteobacteria bacterium]
MTKSIPGSLAITLMLFLSTATLAGEVGISVVFTDAEASIIRAWYNDHTSPQGGNDKKSKGLPPGIAKNLQRGKTLPPGIAKQALPVGLIDRLPPPPHGYERVVLSGKVLLVEVATQLIHDVLEDAILGR